MTLTNGCGDIEMAGVNRFRGYHSEIYGVVTLQTLKLSKAGAGYLREG